MEFTQIQITKETKDKLKQVKITKRETYDEIVRRLLLTYDKHQ